MEIRFSMALGFLGHRFSVGVSGASHDMSHAISHIITCNSQHCHEFILHLADAADLSWQSVVTALKEVGHESLAEKLSSKYR